MEVAWVQGLGFRVREFRENKHSPRRVHLCGALQFWRGIIKAEACMIENSMFSV